MRLVHIVSTYSKQDGIGGIVSGLHKEELNQKIDSLIFARVLVGVEQSSTVVHDHDMNKLRELLRKTDCSNTYFIYHFGVYDSVIDHMFIKEIFFGRVFYYHNVTPDHFYKGWEPYAHKVTLHSRSVIKQLLKGEWVVTGDSWYNIQEIKDLDYPQHTFLAPVFPSTGNTATKLNFVRRKGRKERPSLLFVGRLAPNKRQDVLVLLVKYLKMCGVEVELYLVGRDEGAFSKFVKGIAVLLGVRGNIHFRSGMSSGDLISMYSYCELLVVASEHEGFCIPLIEALNESCIPVGRPFGAVGELLAGSGLLAEGESLLSFFKKVKEVILKLADDDETSKSIESGRVSFQRNTANFLSPTQFFEVLPKSFSIIASKETCK